MRAAEFNKSLIALTAWREAHHYGGHRAMLLVAQIILNRVRQGWGDAAAVIERVPTFSARNVDEQPKGFPDARHPDFVRLLQELDTVYDGVAKDMTDGALYWADLQQISRSWFKEQIVDKPGDHPRTGNLQTLYFFK